MLLRSWRYQSFEKGFPMEYVSYSPYFTTIHDEKEPVGDLGRGTHYSVLRAQSWHSPNFDITSRAYHYDFAVIWDEDHDTRIISCIEEIHLNGLLSKFIMFGERKGLFTAVLNDHFNCHENQSTMNSNLQHIAEKAPDCDCWSAQMMSLNGSTNVIISDDENKTSLYLKTINMLWNLGGKPIPLTNNMDQEIPYPDQKAAKITIPG